MGKKQSHSANILSGFDTGWKLLNEVKRIIIYPMNKIYFFVNSIYWENGWKLYGIPIIQKHRQSVMGFGPGLNLRSSVRSNPLGPNHPVIICTWQSGAKIKVGTNFAMTGGSLVAAEKIVIGNNVAVGANTTIIDTDFHPLDPVERLENPSAGKSAPIVIEDDVFIGMNCLILKGVTLGRGCVIGAGSVVTHDIPAMVIAAGNPARILRRL